MIQTRKIAITAIMSALAIILAVAVHLPIIPSAPFLEYDPADIPIFFCTFTLGIPYGLIMTFIVSIIQGLIASSSGIIGILMHIIATSSFVLTAGLLHKILKGNLGVILSSIGGVIVWIAVMILWNILMTPIFLGTPREAVIKMIIPAILPFNVIKAALNSTIAIILLFAVRPLIKRYLPDNTIERKKNKEKKNENNLL